MAKQTLYREDGGLLILHQEQRKKKKKKQNRKHCSNYISIQIFRFEKPHSNLEYAIYILTFTMVIFGVISLVYEIIPDFLYAAGVGLLAAGAWALILRLIISYS